MSFGKYKVNEVNKTSITSFLQEENYIFKFTRKFINRRNSCIKKKNNKNVLYTFLL
mgnify:CR=1 FL=1|jgi:hypothetical protein